MSWALIDFGMCKHPGTNHLQVLKGDLVKCDDTFLIASNVKINKVEVDEM